jgi:glycosyltransferase involved in cell wall biosynthesis
VRGQKTRYPLRCLGVYAAFPPQYTWKVEQQIVRVAHLVDAMGGKQHLWGKERVVALLMREQRASGRVDPTLITFAPGSLVDLLAAEGFQTASLGAVGSRGFDRAFGRLSRRLQEHPVDVIHSHGYRANIIARMLRVGGGMRGVRLVSTCHGWSKAMLKPRLYNTIDRWSSVLSDVTTVPDSSMLASLPWFARRRHILNAVANVEPAGDATPFVPPGEFVAGTLGRVTADKGMHELIQAAKSFPDPSVVFAIAGDGDLVEEVRNAGGNVRYVGYFARPENYLAGLDVYLQASRTEGLSMSLLEAMRAGKAIVATDVGATRDAVTDGESALVVPAGRPDALRDAVFTLRKDPTLRARLGRNARASFEANFRIQRQHQRYMEVYAGNGWQS